MIIPGHNPPPDQPNGIPYGVAKYVFFGVRLADGNSQICYIPNEVISNPISVILEDGNDLKIEVSVSDQSSIWNDGAETGGLWAELPNSGADTFLSITSPVTAVRVTNQGAVTRLAELAY